MNQYSTDKENWWNTWRRKYDNRKIDDWNANSIVQHVTQIKSGIMKHVNVSLKSVAHTKM